MFTKQVCDGNILAAKVKQWAGVVGAFGYFYAFILMSPRSNFGTVIPHTSAFFVFKGFLKSWWALLSNPPLLPP